MVMLSTGERMKFCGPRVHKARRTAERTSSSLPFDQFLEA